MKWDGPDTDWSIRRVDNARRSVSGRSSPNLVFAALVSNATIANENENCSKNRHAHCGADDDVAPLFIADCFGRLNRNGILTPVFDRAPTWAL